MGTPLSWEDPGVQVGLVLRCPPGSVWPGAVPLCLRPVGLLRGAEQTILNGTVQPLAHACAQYAIVITTAVNIHAYAFGQMILARFATLCNSRNK